MENKTRIRTRISYELWNSSSFGGKLIYHVLEEIMEEDKIKNAIQNKFDCITVTVEIIKGENENGK